jgi:hypothetical protein
MEKFLALLFLSFLTLNFSANAQERFALEFYGGPSQAFLSYELIPSK